MMAQPKSGISDNSYLSVAVTLYKTWFHTVATWNGKRFTLHVSGEENYGVYPKEDGKFLCVLDTFKIRRSKVRNWLLKGVVVR